MIMNGVNSEFVAVDSKKATSPPQGSKIEEQASKRVKISDLIAAMKSFNSRQREKSSEFRPEGDKRKCSETRGRDSERTSKAAKSKPAKHTARTELNNGADFLIPEPSQMKVDREKVLGAVDHAASKLLQRLELQGTLCRSRVYNRFLMLRTFHTLRVRVMQQLLLKDLASRVATR